jgi:ABC-type phosphate transport system substrate-binding protein
MTKHTLLIGASALATAVALAGAASANTPPPLTSPAVTGIYGAGSSLIAPYLAQAEGCYGTPNAFVNQGPSPYTSGETTQSLSPFKYTGAPAADDYTCGATYPTGTDKTTQFFYISSGSGNGVNGFFSHDAQTYWGDFTPGTSPSYFPSVQYGAGDYQVSPADVAIYNTGGGPNGDIKKCYAGTSSCASGATVTYAFTPALKYGPMIEIPLSIDPVAIVYSPVYKKVTSTAGVTKQYSLNVRYVNADGSGGLRLDLPTLCAIFNGKITNWNDPAIQHSNSNIPLQDPSDPDGLVVWNSTGLPIEIVGRADGSGTTSIFYRALAAQCNGSYTEYTYTFNATTKKYTLSPTTIPKTYTNQYAPSGSHNLPNASGDVADSTSPVYTVGNPKHGAGAPVPEPGHYTLASLSSGVATYLDFNDTPPNGSTYTVGRLGYVGTDYVLPSATVTTGNTYGLNLVDIGIAKNSAPSTYVYLEPTQANAIKAFGSSTNALLPPQSTSTGVYTTSPTGKSYGLRSAPADWVEPVSTTWTLSDGHTVISPTPLANPNASGTVAYYPIVGTTQGFFSTCYSSTAIANAVKGFLKYYLTAPNITNTTAGLLAEDGLVPMPRAWLTAELDTFVTPVAAVKPQNLYILPVAATPATATAEGAQCSTKVTPSLVGA